MKFFASFILFSLATFAAGAITKEHMDVFLKTLGECREKHVIGEDVLQKLMTHQLIPEAKCFSACIVIGMNLMTSDNMENVDTMMLGNKMLFENDPENLKKGEQVINACATVTDPDSCEAAYKIHQCLDENKKAVGLQMPF